MAEKIRTGRVKKGVNWFDIYSIDNVRGGDVIFTPSSFAYQILFVPIEDVMDSTTD